MRIDLGDIHLNCEVSGAGTPLVLTHGLGNNLHFWDAHREDLAAHHRLVCWDLRGFGRSDKPAGPYHPAQFAADLARLCDALQLERIHLVGISMGGVIAQRFALDFPARLRSLVLVSTSSEVGARAAAHWQRLADRVERDGFDARTSDAARSFSAAFAAAHPEVVRTMTEQNTANDPKAYAAAARGVSDYHWTAELARIGTPTLILQGLEDQLTPPGGSVKMSRVLRNARLLLIPEVGHNLPLEQPLLFRTALLAFVGGVDAAANFIASGGPL